VVRHGASPALAVVGTLDAAAVDRVSSLFEHLDHTLSSLRYVSYDQAERDALVLAEALTRRLGPARLDEATYVAIPRGGHVVLGLLAMALGLRHEQLGELSEDRARPLVVVDDAILTGYRLARWLTDLDRSEVSVATLYAHPDACREAERTGRGVVACVAARELRDLGPERYGEHYDAWRDSWRRDLDPPRLWIGAPETLVFAWKEPDHSIWNGVTERREPGWRVLPPSLCLAGPQEPLPAGRVQRQPTPVGPWLPCPSVVTAELEGELVVADPERGITLALAGIAAVMWRALVAYGDLPGATRAVQGQVEAPAELIAEDLRAFAAELERRGLTSSRQGHRATPSAADQSTSGS
jgi:hypothetical protein